MNTVENNVIFPQRGQALFLTAKEAAHYLRLSTNTLAAYRVKGTGPAFCKFGSRVVYKLSDLDAWADSNRHQSTTAIN